MRLTPADVHNVAFKKPSIGKRGYDEDEVDAFLDLVEAELARLIEENNDLTQRVAALQGQLADAQNQQPAAAPYGGQSEQSVAPVALEKAPEPVVAEPAQAPAPAVVEAPAVSAPAPELIPADHHLQAARLLGLAQQTAERLTSDAASEADATRNQAKAESEQLLSSARNESDRMLTEARTESDRLVTEARGESERLVTEARNTSDKMVNDATAKAEALERDSRIRADALDREAQTKYSQVMGQLTEQRTVLERKVDDLHTYEREYRTRLKGWITDQLSQLDEGGQPAAAGTAAQGASA